MIVRKISLINFRNYKKFSLAFDKNINIIIGDNAQGKTNILESIYVLAITKSYRTNIDNNLIRFDQEKAIIKGELKDNKIYKQLSCEISKNKKKVKLNDNEIRKIADYIGNMYVILFSPEDIELIKGSPSGRRNFINIEISQISKDYIKLNNEFNKILKIRNDYLKILSVNGIADYRYLDVLTSNLIDRAVDIYIYRKKYIDQINEKIKEIYKNIADIDDLKIFYETNVEFESFDQNVIKEVLNKKYKDNMNREIMMGMTLYGPHRDDFKFLIGDNDLKLFGSQGQQKLAIIAFKLAEISIFKEATNTEPILLLDDIFSELDKTKKNRLIKYISDNLQVIITANDTKDISRKILREAKIIKISEGKIVEKGGNNNGK